jgi:ADP-ribose pyrophosphatase YjhB (NUDIX family)
MHNRQPIIVDAARERTFACFPAAVLAFVVDAEERILLLAHPRRKGEWEVVNGALEAGETLLDEVMREVREEIGDSVRVRPLGTLHAFTFVYDGQVQYMLSLCYLLEHQGGEVRPGDDMRGSAFRWWSLDELADDGVRLIVPRDQKWLAARAIGLYRLWRDQQVDLQPTLDPGGRAKYAL